MKQQTGTQSRLGIAGWAIILMAFALGIWCGPLAAQSQDADERIAYRVKPGDTLIGLSRTYFRKADDWREVQRINRIANPNRLRIASTMAIPVRLLRSTPVELRVDSFTGPVRVEGSGAPKGASVGLVVDEGSTVRTGPRGFVTLAATGGDTVSLPSQTAVRLVRARRYLINDRLDVLFALANGRATFSPTPKRDGDRWRVRTPVAVTAVRGTIFRIFHDADEITSGTEVVEGTVELAGGETSRPLEEGFGNVAKPSGLLPPEQLLPAPTIVDPGRVQTDTEVTFAIAPVSGASGYRVQVARDAGFLDVVAQDVTDRPEASFEDIGNGTYFVRSMAIAESGLEGFAEAYSFRRQRVGVVASVEESPLGNGFKFAWRPQGEDTALYDFKLWREDREDRPLVAELGMHQRELVLTDLPPGTYFWQVTALRIAPEGIVSATASPQKLTVSP